MRPAARCVWILWALTFAWATTRAPAQSLLVDPEAQLARALEEFDEGQDTQQTDPDRARRLFRSAAQRLENIIATGVVNGYLEYNLGNCHLQAGDLGLAILHYRRAERLIPNDPLLEDNLKLARSRCLTSISRGGRTDLLRKALFLHYDLARDDRARVALVFYMMTWLLLLVRVFVRRRSLAWLACMAGLLAASLGISVGVDRWSDRNAPGGVVTAMDVVAYKGPGEGYRRQFEQPLQPGVEFTLAGRRGQWWLIELADGKTGWIERSAAVLIPPPSD